MKKKKTNRRGLLGRAASFFRNMLRPRNALPCVGLVVLGGCLTFIIAPDEPDPPAEDLQPGEFPVVILDPGHGGRDEGTKWRGLAEKNLTLELATRTEKVLKSAGFRTEMTRRDDTYVPLEERARLANTHRNAIFVSIHFNSENSGTTSGIETHFARAKDVATPDWSWIGFFNRGESNQTDTSETLAGTIQTSLVERTEAKSRGIHANNFYVIHHTRCPAVLVEGGFISNAFEAQLLGTDTYRDLLAQGIAQGLLRFLQTQPGQPPAPTTTAALQRP